MGEGGHLLRLWSKRGSVWKKPDIIQQSALQQENSQYHLC